MTIERQYGFYEISPTVEDLWVKEKCKVPAIVLSKDQTRLIFREDNTRQWIGGVPIAKPWQTSYRGELFIYIPIRTKNVQIDIPKETSGDKPILDSGIIGIANLKSIALIQNEKDWQESFDLHREIGSKPFDPTYLWFLQNVNQFWFPNGAILGGKWEYNERLGLENNILTASERSLHFVSIRQFLYHS